MESNAVRKISVVCGARVYLQWGLCTVAVYWCVHNFLGCCCVGAPSSLSEAGPGTLGVFRTPQGSLTTDCRAAA